MIYLLIKNGVVVNRIEADESFIPNIKADYDHILEDQINADIGYSYDGKYFTAPLPKAETIEEKIASKKADMQFGDDLMVEFAVSSDDRNLTDDQRIALAEKLNTVQGLLQIGSLNAAAKALNDIPNDEVLPQVLVDAFVLKLNTYLEE